MEHDEPPYDRIADYLQQELDDDLRAVSYYSPRTEVIAYMRDDLQARYTDQETREILYETLLDATEHSRFEELLGADLVATVRVFEDRAVTILPTGVQEAIIISIERADGYSYFELLSKCQRILSS